MTEFKINDKVIINKSAIHALKKWIGKEGMVNVVGCGHVGPYYRIRFEGDMHENFLPSEMTLSMQDIIKDYCID